MKEYIEDAKEASNDWNNLEAYDKEWALKDQALRDGYQEGFDIGIEKGIEQGIKQGIKQKEKDIVINMLKKGIDINTIAEITKLSINEINFLKENADN